MSTGKPIGFEIITLFPEMFVALRDHGVVGRAHQQRLWHYRCWNPRDFAPERQGRVDDRPFGGGAGMVMQVKPLDECIAAMQAQWQQEGSAGWPTEWLCFSPRGPVLQQPQIAAWRDASLSLQNSPQAANGMRFVLLCGRYEGIDERILQLHPFRLLSVGAYVLSGGELPAMVLMDALIRQQEGVLGNPESLSQESFSMSSALPADAPQLEYPHYTRPASYKNLAVPHVLLSGDHTAIALWRKQQSQQQTTVQQATAPISEKKSLPPHNP